MKRFTAKGFKEKPQTNECVNMILIIPIPNQNHQCLLVAFLVL